MTADSPAELLVLHAVRILGFADQLAVARRFGLDPAETAEVLGDAEAHGWVTHARFGGVEGWSLTEIGREENERLLAAELGSVDGANEVLEVHSEFLPLNNRLQQACTNWQLRPVPGSRLATNDHTDTAWDAAVLEELTRIQHALAPIETRLGEVLTRFRGYDARFTRALRRARSGEEGWIDRTDVDSCHRVWFELHEDLIATLGLRRGMEP